MVVVTIRTVCPSGTAAATYWAPRIELAPRLVLDDDIHAQGGLHLLRDDPAGDVGRAAGGVRHHQRHRLGWEGLRIRF